jgi:hypothetical protein
MGKKLQETEYHITSRRESSKDSGDDGLKKKKFNKTECFTGRRYWINEDEVAENQ